MIEGVTKGFVKELEIVGTGYRAKMEGSKLVINVGFSHPVEFTPPPGIQFEVEGQNIIRVKGIDKYLVGDVAATIRRVRPPEPYKGKGIRYRGEIVRRKAGKAGVKAGGK
jgi:large subunit ribosomal protein L6